jgi:hypothetical protein
MIIHATFANRRHDPAVFELVDAWDEWSVDSNPEGFERSRQAALDSWGEDLLRYVTVAIEVPEDSIDSVLNPRIHVLGSIVLPT